MYKLAPSILAADFTKLGEEIKKIDKAGADYVHIDVCDGMFVPSISFGMPVIQAIRGVTDRFFDVHLMIEEPGRYIEEFAQAGADGITVHAECCAHLDRTLAAIRERGLRASVALNPATPLAPLLYVLDKVDMILLMTVNPGFGGQKLIESSYRKIADLKRLLSEEGRESVDIQVDGGINTQNAGRVIAAGANILVAGTAVFHGDVDKNVAFFKGVFRDAA